MIYYICDDIDQPGGGRRVIYQHVEILNAHGIGAKVVHQKFPFRATWHGMDVPVTWLDLAQSAREPGDWFVIPEIFSPMLAQFPGNPTVAFVQGAYLAHSWEIGKENPYKSATAAMVVSSDSLNEVYCAYPWLETRRVYNSVDVDLFRYQEQKEKILLYNPRKNNEILANIVKVLLSRGGLEGWQVAPVYGTPQAVADAFARGAIYLTTSLYEGFGMMPLEAGLSGCGVIGYSGFGGDEYWGQAGFMKVNTGSIREFVNAIEWAVGAGLRTSRKTAEWIKTTYSRERQAESVLGFWRGLMGEVRERRVSVIIPTMGRAEQLRKNIQTLLVNTPGELEIIVVVDEDRESVEAVKDLPVKVIFRECKRGALSGWNEGLKMSELTRPDDLFVLGADDCIYNPGWYEEMVKTAETGDYIGLTYFDNGTDRWPTHYAVTRQFMLDYLNGSLAMDAYHHNCTDLESWQRALRVGGYVEGKEIIEHCHPAYGTAAIDETYKRGALFQEKDDLNLYYARKADGFPNSWEPAIER